MDAYQDDELKALEAQAAEQERTKGYLRAAGGVLDNFQSIPSAHEMLYGGKAQAPTASKVLGGMADSMSDPMERQQKAMAYLKDKGALARGQKDAEFTDFERARARKSQEASENPLSPKNMAARAFYKKQGFEVGDSDVESDLMGRYGAASDLTKMSLEEKRRMREEQARQAFEREKQKNTLDMELAKSGNTQAFELDKQGRGFNHDKEMAGLKGEQEKLKMLAESKSKGAKTAGTEAIDKKYAEHWTDYTGKGRVNAVQTINQLEALKRELDDESKKWIQSGGGRIGGSLPDNMRSETALRWKSEIPAKANLVLKDLFGGQLSDGERKSESATYYNDLLGPEANSSVLAKKIDTLKKQVQAEDARAKYFNEHGTLAGYVQPSMSEEDQEYVAMYAPDGTKKRVKKSDVQRAIAAGGKFVDGPAVGAK
jgi:hypothetical protein